MSEENRIIAEPPFPPASPFTAFTKAVSNDDLGKRPGLMFWVLAIVGLMLAGLVTLLGFIWLFTA